MSKQGGSEEQLAPYNMADLGSALPTGSSVGARGRRISGTLKASTAIQWETD